MENDILIKRLRKLIESTRKYFLLNDEIKKVMLYDKIMKLLYKVEDNEQIILNLTYNYNPLIVIPDIQLYAMKRLWNEI